MKNFTKLTTTFLFALLFSVTNLFSQTTQEEYNYITKGYKVQIESGLDMKKGYSFVDLGNWNTKSGTENREIEFKGLMRIGQAKPCAIMMIYRRTDIPTGVVEYVCIPSKDAPENIWKQTNDFVFSYFNNNNSMQQAVIWALIKFGSQETSK